MEAAVRVLVNQRSSPQEIQQANDFLLQYFEEKDCFTEALRLLTLSNGNSQVPPDYYYTRQFYATTLHKKVRKHWSLQLKDEEKAVFIQTLASSFINQILQGSAKDVDRSRILYEELFTRMLSAAVLRSPQFLSSYYQLADQCFQRGKDSLQVFLTALKMLIMLSDESRDLDSSRRGKSALDQEVNNYFESSMVYVCRFVASLEHSPSQVPGQIRLALLQFLHERLQLQGMQNLMTFNRNYPQCLNFILQHLFVSIQDDAIAARGIVTTAHNIILDLLVTQEYPANEENEKIRAELRRFVFEQSSVFLVTWSQSSYEEQMDCDVISFIIAQQLLRTFVTLALQALHTSSSATSLESIESAQQRIHLILQQILLITSCPNRKFLLTSFDFWFEVQEILIAAAEEESNNVILFNSHEVLRGLFDVLRQACLFPLPLRHRPSDLSWQRVGSLDIDEEVLEDFKTLRNRDFGIDELFQFCFDHCSVHCLHTLQHQLATYLQSSSFSTIDSWQSLDALLFVTGCCMKSIKESFPPSEIASFLFSLAVTSLAYLDQLSHLTQTLAVVTPFRLQMVASFTRYFSSISSLMTSSLESSQSTSQLLLHASKLCLSMALDENTSEEAEEAKDLCTQLFFKLFTQNKDFFGQQLTSLNEILQFFLGRYSQVYSTTQEKRSNRIIEAFSVVLIHNKSLDLLSTLATPFMQGLQALTAVALTQRSNPQLNLTTLFLLHCQQIIRTASDHRTKEIEDFVELLFCQLFPSLFSLIQSLSASPPSTHQHYEVITIVFSCYSSSIPLTAWGKSQGEREMLYSNYRKQILQQLFSLLSLSSQSSILVLSRIIMSCLIVYVDVFDNSHITNESERRFYETSFLNLTETLGKCLLEVWMVAMHSSSSIDVDSFPLFFDLCLPYVTKPHKRQLLAGKTIVNSLFTLFSQLLITELAKEVFIPLCNSLQSTLGSLERQSDSEQYIWQEILPHLAMIFSGLTHQLSLPHPHATIIPAVGDSFSAVIAVLLRYSTREQVSQMVQQALLENVAVVKIVSKCIESGDFRGEEERQQEVWKTLILISQLLTRLAETRSRRLKAFLTDVNRICLGEETLEALLGYTEELA